jgi:hypothetical protein
MPNPKAKIEITAKDLTKEAFRSVGKSLKTVTGSIFNMKTALAAVAGAAGFGLLIKSSLKSIDVLGKTADKIGITTEGLTKLQLAASIAGTSSAVLNKALQKMVVAVGEAGNGVGVAKQAFAQLGISIKDVIELNPEEQFGVISDALNSVENNTQKLTLAYEIFGAKGTELLNIMRMGKDGLADIGREAELFGLTMSRETVAGVEAANDALTRLFSLGEGFSKQLTAALAPAIEDVTTALKDFIIETAASEGGIRGFAQSFAIDLLNGFKSGVEGIKKFLEFVDKAKIKLIELGIIDNSVQEKRIAHQKIVIANLQKQVARQTRLNLAQDPIIVENLAKAQAELNKELGGEVSIIDKTIAGFDTIIEKLKVTQALTKSGIVPVTPPKPPKPSGSTTIALGLTDDEKEKRLETVKAFLAAQSEAIGLSFLTDEEQLLMSHERRSLIVEEAAARDVITEERKKEIIKKLDEKLAKDQLAIEKKKEKSKQALQISGLKHASGILNSLTSLVGSSSKKQFELGKKMAKAAVVIDTAAGIMKVIGQGGFVGIAAAVGVAIAGAAQLANINRTQFGGGGGISAGGVNFPSPTAGAPPGAIAPTTPIADQVAQSAINITIQGNVLGNEEFVTDTLVPILQDSINNNDTVLINGNSAQALELAV